MSEGPESLSEALLDPLRDAHDDWLERLRRASRPAELGSIGSYRVLDTRRGGQGLVLRAVQPGTQRIVALKRAGAGRLSSSREQRRFEREAELLVELEHPGIVRVYGIEIVDQVPLLVMEWIDGVGLIEWKTGVGGSPRSLRERLECFLAICDAVQFAHQRGVLHRDLKPSNILVDRDNRAHILDFGLAQRTSIPAEETLSFGYVGTPAYSAPESFTDTGVRPDVRSDIWSLGVVLYELICGQRPFEGNSLQSLIEAVTTKEPARPASPDAKVDRDLQAIMLTALAKPLVERYSTVSHLAEDLRRYLRQEPISARPRRTSYLISKWIVRHRLASSLIAVCALLLILGMSYAGVQARHIAHERDQVIEEQTRTKEALQIAERNADKAGRIQAFYLKHIFAPFGDGEGEDRERSLVFVRSVTDDAQQFFVDYPGVGPEVLSKLAHALMNMHQFEEVEDLAKGGLAALAEDDLLGSPIAGDLYLLLCTCLRQRGELIEAREQIRLSVQTFENNLDANRPGGHASALMQQAVLDVDLGDYEAALTALDRAIDVLIDPREDLDLYVNSRLQAEGLRGQVLIYLDRLPEAFAALDDLAGRASALPDLPASIVISLSTVFLARFRAAEDWPKACEQGHLMMDALARTGPGSIHSSFAHLLYLAQDLDLAGFKELGLGLLERLGALDLNDAEHRSLATTLAIMQSR